MQDPIGWLLQGGFGQRRHAYRTERGKIQFENCRKKNPGRRGKMKEVKGKKKTKF
jgi:hypothetical protein